MTSQVDDCVSVHGVSVCRSRRTHKGATNENKKLTKCFWEACESRSQSRISHSILANLV